jgi:hypothetical protein
MYIKEYLTRPGKKKSKRQVDAKQKTIEDRWEKY